MQSHPAQQPSSCRCRCNMECILLGLTSTGCLRSGLSHAHPWSCEKPACSLCPWPPSWTKAYLTQTYLLRITYKARTFVLTTTLTCGAQRLDPWVSDTLAAAAAGASTKLCGCCLIRRPWLLPLCLLKERGTQHHCLDCQRRPPNQLQYLCESLQAPCSQTVTTHSPPAYCPALLRKRRFGEKVWPQSNPFVFRGAA